MLYRRMPGPSAACSAVRERRSNSLILDSPVRRLRSACAQFRALLAGAAAVVAVLSCVAEPPAGLDSTAQIGLHASITGLAADGDYWVAVRITALGSDGPVDLSVDPDTIPLSAEPLTAQMLTVDLAGCPDGCPLSAILTLTDGIGDLAADTLELGTVRQGDQITSPDTVRMEPRFELRIGGGGEGAGSGAVAVAEFEDVPALQCEITDGQAAPTGCSARYRLHAEIELVAIPPEGAALPSWTGDCEATPVDARCQLTMEGRRAAGAIFGLPPTTGDFEIQIAGLPEVTEADVTVTGPGDFPREVTASTVPSDLPPGDYTVAAEQVLTYSPDPALQTIRVEAGEQATAQVSYNPSTTGTLGVTVRGLPEGVAADVTVTGPGLPGPRQLTGSEQIDRGPGSGRGLPGDCLERHRPHDRLNQFDPVWSPDGSSIAFVGGDCAFFCSIYSMNADGSDTLNLTAGITRFATTPSWSNDGAQIAFTGDSCNDGCLDIYVMDADGFDPVNLTGEGEGQSPEWSPAGNRIAFTQQTCSFTGCENDIWIFQRSTGLFTNLTDSLAGDSRAPAWSPDGSTIAFVHAPCDTCQAELFTMSAENGSNARVVPTHMLGMQSAAWSPDGRRIAFEAEGQLFAVGADGSALVQLGPGSDPDWR